MLDSIIIFLDNENDSGRFQLFLFFNLASLFKATVSNCSLYEKEASITFRYDITHNFSGLRKICEHTKTNYIEFIKGSQSSLKTQLLLFPQLLSNCTLYYCWQIQKFKTQLQNLLIDCTSVSINCSYYKELKILSVSISNSWRIGLLMN